MADERVAVRTPEAVDETARMSAVRRYNILDTPPDGAFDRITALAARLLDTPIAIVSIVDADRIWFKSHHGLDVEEVARDPGLCASAILQDNAWVVTDAAVDPRALANPLVAGQFGLRFYAGVPLETRDGHNLGTLCVIDQQPRDITADQLSILRDLATVVVDELELRLSAARVLRLESELRAHAEYVADTLQRSLLPPELPSTPGLDIAVRYHVSKNDQVGGDFFDVVPTDRGVGIVVGDVCGKGVAAAALTGTARWALRTVMLAEWTPASALDRLNQVLLGGRSSPNSYCTVALAAATASPGGGADMTVCLGGHPHPLVVSEDGVVHPIGESSPVVGWFADSRYREQTVHLSTGDTAVFFTDGLLEALAGRGSDDDAVLRAVLSSLAGLTAEAAAEGVDMALREHAVDGLLRDDAAFLIVRASA